MDTTDLIGSKLVAAVIEPGTLSLRFEESGRTISLSSNYFICFSRAAVLQRRDPVENFSRNVDKLFGEIVTAVYYSDALSAWVIELECGDNLFVYSPEPPRDNLFILRDADTWFASSP